MSLLKRLLDFIFYYVQTMRLYYGFVTGIGGWLGLSFYMFLYPQNCSLWHQAGILGVMFLAWGVNQVVNDWLGLPEDRVNAPNRPMVTGKLPVVPALVVTAILLSAALGLSWYWSPLAAGVLVAGVVMNVIYEYSKAWSLLGNVVFGVMMALCPVYGFLAAGEYSQPLFTSNRICGLFLVALMNGLMTYYTYFKDYEGDRAAGRRTFIVRRGLHVAKRVGLVAAFAVIASQMLFIGKGWLSWSDILYPREFIFCTAVALFLQLWTGVRFFIHPSGDRTYFSLGINIQACVAGQIVLIAIFNGTLALFLLSGSLLLIQFLFSLHEDAKA